jgi:hypothetical protein
VRIAIRLALRHAKRTFLGAQRGCNSPKSPQRGVRKGGRRYSCGLDAVARPVHEFCFARAAITLK